MRKKDFKTPNQELPVESVNETKKSDIFIGFEISYDGKTISVDKNAPDGIGDRISSESDEYAAKLLAAKRFGIKKKKEFEKISVKPLYRKGRKITDQHADERYDDSRYPRYWSMKKLELVKNHDRAAKREIRRRIASKEYTFEEENGAKRGTQVKGRDATPKKSKPTRKCSSPHPMRGKLVGEGATAQTAAEFIKELRNNGWEVYISKINHGVEGAHRIELERGGKEITIVGKNSNWELFADGPTVSGRGEAFDSLLSALNAATSFNEAMDAAPLDVKTLTPAQVAEQHGVPFSQIKSQLAKGIKVEMEHTTDRVAAREIALDHLMEMPDYYDRLTSIEEMSDDDINFFVQQVMWEEYQLNERIIPRADAILLAALKYIDKLLTKDDSAQRHGVASAAFDTARAFRLDKSSRELQQLYHQWKETGKLPDATN
jgi:hypothetical protein